MIDSCICLMYDGNYPAGRARSIYSSYFTQGPSFDVGPCKFTQGPSFDLFQPKEAWMFTQRPSFDLFRPSFDLCLDNAMDGYTQAHAERQTEGETL